jgi:hypothetical protein
VQAAPPLAAEATSVQQTEPQPAGGGNTKKDKERQRKERQRQRKMEEAWEALRRAMEVMEETAGGAGCVDAVEEAMQVAEKHVARSESLAALVEVARTLVEQARAAEAERVRVAAAAAAVGAAERLRLEEVAAELTLRMQGDALRMQSDALMLQQVQAQLGSSVVPPVAPAPDEEDQCVMCFDAPKDHIIIPCGHVCVCEACANQLTQVRKPTCPICRTAIQLNTKVFHS